MEGRLGDRARAADARHARDPPVRDVHQLGAVPGGAGRRPDLADDAETGSTTTSCAPPTRARRAPADARSWTTPVCRRCRSRGAYFLLSDVSRLGFAGDVDFCRHLCTEVGVAAIPTSVFYAAPARAPMLARFCFAKREETIQAAGERLRKLRPLH